MISADFYPSRYFFNQSELTNNINLSSTGVIANNAYWLGYGKWENMPDCWKLSSFIQTTDTIMFENETTPQNFNVGYCSSYGSISTQGFFTYGDRELYLYDGYPKQYINKCDMMSCGLAPEIRNFYLFAFIKYGTEEGNLNYTDFANPFYGAFSINRMLDFLNGETSFNLTINFPFFGSFTTTYHLNDITENNTWVQTGNQNNYYYEITFFIVNTHVFNGVDVNSSGSPYGQQTGIIPAIGYTIGNTKYVFTGGGTFPSANSGFYYYSCRWDNNNLGLTATPAYFNNYLLGGFVGTFNKTDMQTLSYNNFIINGNTCYARTTNAYYLARVISPQEITKIISIFPRVGYVTGGSYIYGYQNNISWATHVSEDNEFLFELITGDLTDDEFKAKLRPWQYDINEWAENDYTEEDLPPYEGGGDDEGETETGQSVIRPSSITVGGTNGFITQYALRSEHVAGLGKALWTSMLESNFWQNVIWATAFETGSFDVASLLDYFISLRVYPFPLINLASFQNTGIKSLYLGKGIVALDLNSQTNVATISQYSDYIDAGYVRVPRYYNDFRDYSETTVTAYLPFIGTVQLNAADVMGKTLSLQYAVDFSTGTCVAYLDAVDDGGIQYPVVITQGTIGADIPLSASNASRLAAQAVQDTTQAVGTIAAIVATGGAASATEATALQTTSAIAQGTKQAVSMANNPITSTVCGHGSGFANFGAPQAAYIQIRRAITKNPPGFAHAVGKLSMSTTTVGSLSGFTTFINPDLSPLGVDAETCREIAGYLESGVYI